MIRLTNRLVVALLLVVVMLAAAPVVLAQGDDTPTEDSASHLSDVLTDPETLAAIVMLAYAGVFDLFERALVALGWQALIDNSTKKRVIAWVLSGALSVGVFYGTSLLFPDNVTFTFDGAFALATAVVGIVLGQVSFMVHRASGMLISSKAAG